MVNINILLLFLVTTTLLYSTQFFLFETSAQSGMSSFDNDIVTNDSTMIEEGVGSASISPTNPGLQNDFDNWNVISGIWNYSSSLLEGGTGNDTASPADNTIVNPTSVEDLSKVTTIFKIDDLDTNLTSYATIVYSYTDPETYKKAGVYVIKDDISVRFADIENGSVVQEPLHPYISTGLKWSPGNTYNLTVGFQDNIQSLILNGTQYAGKNDTNVDGLLGLNYGRIMDIDFYNFSFNSMNAPNQNNETEQSMNAPNQNNETEQSMNAPNQNDGSILGGSERFIGSDSQTIILGEKSLPSDNFIHLYDSSPYKIVEGHIAAKLPCNENTDSESTNSNGPN